MSFSENLKQIRKERRLSQEELAEVLGVSRQAVSKWEQGQGYPEMETLLLLAGKLNVPLDALMSSEIACGTGNERACAAGAVMITSPHEHVIARCSKVVSSKKMKGGKRSPQYALFGVDGSGYPFWGEANTFLGWYANEAQISKEIEAIHSAIIRGVSTYTLQYSAKTERRWAGIRLVDGERLPAQEAEGSAE